MARPSHWYRGGPVGNAADDGSPSISGTALGVDPGGAPRPVVADPEPEAPPRAPSGAGEGGGRWLGRVAIAARSGLGRGAARAAVPAEGSSRLPLGRPPRRGPQPPARDRPAQHSGRREAPLRDAARAGGHRRADRALAHRLDRRG